jgi:hypothetical protein
MRKTVAWPVIITLGILCLILGAWNIYAVIENSYWEGVKNSAIFTRCRHFTPWTSDMEKMKGRQVNDCQELFTLISTESDDDNKVAIEPEAK